MHKFWLTLVKFSTEYLNKFRHKKMLGLGKDLWCLNGFRNKYNTVSFRKWLVTQTPVSWMEVLCVSLHWAQNENEFIMQSHFHGNNFQNNADISWPIWLIVAWHDQYNLKIHSFSHPNPSLDKLLMVDGLFFTTVLAFHQLLSKQFCCLAPALLFTTQSESAVLRYSLEA